MEKIAVLVGLKNNRITKADLAAVTMARGDGRKLFALLPGGGGTDPKTQLEQYGVEEIVRVQGTSGPIPWHPQTWAKAAIDAMTHFDIHWLIGSTGSRGADLLPRIAAGLDAPLVMDVLGVGIERREVTKSQFSGKALATFALKGDDFVVGVRPNAVEPVAAVCKAEVRTFTTAIDQEPMIIEHIDHKAENRVDLTEAEIIISGGRAMKNGENFGILEACASQMGAAVGASRAAVDSGYVPHTMQVGQTGSTVSPKVYIACGISGAVQHFAGMKTSKLIVAVNTDPAAAMVQRSDYAIVGDLFEIVPLLTAELKKRQSADNNTR